MSARDDAMRRREERAAERLAEVGMNVPNFGGMRGKFDAKLHPKDRTGKWRQTFTSSDVHHLHVAGGQKHIATITKGQPNAKGQDTFHVKSEVGAGAKHATAGSLPEAKKIAHAMHGLKHEDIQHTGDTSPKASGGGAPAAKPSGTPAVGSKAHQESLKPKPAGQEHGDWRDPHHNTGYSAAEYAQHHAQNEKFYKSSVQTLADGPDHMSTKPSVGGPKITKHAGSYYVEHHDNVDANRPLWKSGKVPVLAGKFKSASAAAAAAAKMDTQDYMEQRRAEREAKGMAHGDSHAPVASASGGKPSAPTPTAAAKPPLGGVATGNGPAPQQTLETGKQVTLHNPNESYDQLGGKIHGKTATIVGFASPEIRKNQVWSAESYYVRLEGDPPGTKRVVDRANIKPYSGGVGKPTPKGPDKKFIQGVGKSPLTPEEHASLDSLLTKARSAAIKKGDESGRKDVQAGKKALDQLKHEGASPENLAALERVASGHPALAKLGFGGGTAAPPVFATRAKAHKELKPGDTFQIPDSASWKRSAGAKHGRVYKVVAGPGGKNRSVAHTTSDEKAANVASSQKRIAQQTASEKKPTPAETAAHQAQFEADLKGSAAGGLKASKKLDQQITDTQAKIPGAGAVVNGKAGRWVKLNGKMVHIPHHGDFLRVVGTDHFSSPDGGTTVYKNGSPYSASKAAAKSAAPSAAGSPAPPTSRLSPDGTKLASLATKAGSLPEAAASATEALGMLNKGVKGVNGGAAVRSHLTHARRLASADYAGGMSEAERKSAVGKEMAAASALLHGGKPDIPQPTSAETKQLGAAANDLNAILQSMNDGSYGKKFTDSFGGGSGARTRLESASQIAQPGYDGALSPSERIAHAQAMLGAVKPKGTPSGAANPDNLTQALKGELAAQGGAAKPPSATRQQARLDAAKVGGRMPPPLATPQVPALGGMTPLGITPSGSKAVLKPELNSPARSSAGRLRNFKSMSTDKLTQTLVATTAHGNDPEALQALQHEAAQRLGVHVPALAASLAPKAPSAPSAPAAAQAAGQAAARAGVVAAPSGGKAVETFKPDGPVLDPNFIGSPGRSGAGRLRNFKQMSQQKLLNTEQHLDDYRQNNEQDYDAENFVAAEINRRINAGDKGYGAPRSVGGKTMQAAQKVGMGDRDAAMARRVQRRLSLIEAADSMAKASTPEPFSKSKTSNWVARGGGLPAYIQHIAHDLVEKRGMPESKAIAMAIGIVKRWARGGGKVDAGTRAAASKAVAEWEKLKAGAHAKH